MPSFLSFLPSLVPFVFPLSLSPRVSVDFKVRREVGQGSSSRSFLLLPCFHTLAVCLLKGEVRRSISGGGDGGVITNGGRKCQLLGKATTGASVFLELLNDTLPQSHPPIPPIFSLSLSFSPSSLFTIMSFHTINAVILSLSSPLSFVFSLSSFSTSLFFLLFLRNFLFFRLFPSFLVIHIHYLAPVSPCITLFFLSLSFLPIPPLPPCFSFVFL